MYTDRATHSSSTAPTLTDHDPAADVEQFRARLLGISGRMLNDAHEAEDVVQEAYLRWHQTERFAVGSREAWLVAVVTRLSIDRLRRARVERRLLLASDSSETWEAALTPTLPSTDRRAELASDVSAALRTLRERLAPDEQLALVLRDVFDVEYDEIARILERKKAAVRQLVHRARVRVKTPRTRFTSVAHPRQRLDRRFAAALAADDRQALLALFRSTDSQPSVA